MAYDSRYNTRPLVYTEAEFNEMKERASLKGALATAKELYPTNTFS